MIFVLDFTLFLKKLKKLKKGQQMCIVLHYRKQVTKFVAVWRISENNYMCCVSTQWKEGKTVGKKKWQYEK